MITTSFVLIAICITIIYLVIVYFFNKKYNIIEKLGNYTGNYNSRTLFRIPPLFVKTDSKTSFKGPLEINIKQDAGNSNYEYNEKLSCTADRSDYVQATSFSAAYCTQTRDGGKGTRKIFDSTDNVKDYRVRFLGIWKDKDGELYNIKKKEGTNDTIIFTILNEKIKPTLLIQLHKPGASVNALKFTYEGTIVPPEDTINNKTPKVPYITFSSINNIKDISMCVENTSYSGNTCMHSEIKQTLEQTHSDFILLGSNPADASSIKLYKTFDETIETSSYTLTEHKDYLHNPNNVYEQTDVNITKYNLNTECSIPCKNATDCTAFAFIPASLDLLGKCVFYNVDNKSENQTFTVNSPTTLQQLSDHLVIDKTTLLNKNKTVLNLIGIDTIDSQKEISKGTIIMIPNKVTRSGSYLYELNSVPQTA